MKKIFVLLTVFSAIALGSQSVSAAQTLLCSNCTQNQASNMALSTAGGFADHYVFIADYEGENLWKFHVEAETESGQSWKYATPVTVESEAQSIFAAWISFKNQSTPHGDLDLPVSVGVGSAYDFFPTNSPNYQAVLNWAAGTAHFGFPNLTNPQYKSLIWSGGKWYNEDPFITGTITFPDGSTVDLQAEYLFDDYLTATMALGYIDDTAFDNEGNSIPDGISDITSQYSATFRGTEGNAERFINLMGRFGISTGGNYASPHIVCGSACNLGGPCTLTCSFP